MRNFDFLLYNTQNLKPNNSYLLLLILYKFFALFSDYKPSCLLVKSFMHSMPYGFCTDNAVMIASLAYHKYKANLFADISLEAKAGSDD
jgi:hypothetical protein